MARLLRENWGTEGQALPLIALIVVVAGLAVMGIGRLGGLVADRARASAGADAAALAGAADGESAARQLATRNGGHLLSYEAAGSDVRVRVGVGRATSSARARRSDGSVPSAAAGHRVGGDGDPGGLAPAMRAALARADQLLGGPVPITSGYRSPSRQAQLWAHRFDNPYPVAPPGSSMHERGLAVDVPLTFVDRLLAVAPQVGLCHPYPDTDPIHFEVCRR